MANFNQVAAARDRSGLSQPPAPLAAAIASAAGRYSIPPAVLTGIWRIESGSSYPNRYVNSSGYGGLFGTTDWNGSVQSQADLAASILNRLLAENGGDMSGALSRYSGGGYTAVPGGGAPAYGSRGTRPGGGGGVTGFLGGLAHSVASPFESAWNDTVGAMGSVVDFLKVMAWLVNPLTWLRAAEFLAGFVLMLAGLFFYGSATGGRSPASKSAPLAKLPGLGPIATGIVKGMQGTRKARVAAGQKKQRAAAASTREQRTSEMHTERVRTQRARTASIARQARTRRRTRQEQEGAERRAFVRGATEQAAHSETARRSARRRAAARRA